MSATNIGSSRANRFEGLVAIVTGSTQGVGELLLHQMTDEGLAGAVVTGRDSPRGQAVARALSDKGCEAVFVKADLFNIDDVNAVVEAADKRWGRVDLLANCAAFTDRGTVWDTELDDFDAMMAVNVRAPFQLIQAVAKIARRERRPASIANVGSISGHGGQAFITAYCASKGALMTLTRNVAFQLMRHQIRVNTVNPGWMNTPGEDATQRRWHGASDGWLEAAAASQPWGRLVSMQELVNTLCFVLSDESGLMSGVSIDLDQSIPGAGDVSLPPPELGPNTNTIS